MPDLRVNSNRGENERGVLRPIRLSSFHWLFIDKPEQCKYRFEFIANETERVTARTITLLRRDLLPLSPAYIETHVSRVLVLIARLKLAQTQIAG